MYNTSLKLIYSTRVEYINFREVLRIQWVSQDKRYCYLICNVVMQYYFIMCKI